jgi:hypothetical protein
VSDLHQYPYEPAMTPAFLNKGADVVEKDIMTQVTAVFHHSPLPWLAQSIQYSLTHIFMRQPTSHIYLPSLTQGNINTPGIFSNPVHISRK